MASGDLDEIIEEEVEALRKEEKNARNTGDFTKADQMRGESAKKGIVLEDGKDGVVWRKI